MKNHSKTMTGALLVAVTLVAVGCAGATTVGSGLDTDDLSGSGGPRLGEQTDEPSPTPTESATPTPTPTATVASTATPTPEPTQAASSEPTQQIAIEVQINPDTGPSQFDPSLARLYAGTCVRWTNADAVDRSVEADDASFASGTLVPGATFVHCFETPGKFNYHDGTRPYAVAAVEVLAQ